jgi:hypothetical protein
MKKLTPTILLPVLLFLSTNLHAQTGKRSGPSLWLQGNQLTNASQSRAMNFNPAMVLGDQPASIKIPGHISSLRRVTIFTVYQEQAKEEQAIWQINGRLGDISLSTQQVSSRNTALAFSKNNSTPGNAINVPLIHTYQGGYRATGNDDGRNKDTWVKFGQAGSQGSVAEFILYERILNEAELAKTETYLALKYGISLEKNYLSASGSIIWNYKGDNYYSHHIAGIGRDDRTSLNQKQSASCYQPGALTIGVHKIVSSNQANTGQLNNGDYLVWGNNDQPLTFQETIKAGDNEMLLSGKKWLMKRSGNTAHTISTELTIDTRSLFSHCTKDNFYLLIDRSGTGNFLPANCTYLTPASVSAEGIANFTGIQWDTDNSGKDIFAVGLKVNQPAAKESKTAPGVVSFRLYPNPVTDGTYKVAVVLDKPTDIQIRVYDLQQRLIDIKKGTGQSDYLFTGHINAPAGPYLVRLITPDSELNRIIILQ